MKKYKDLNMGRLSFLFLMIFSISVSTLAQKVEHGMIAGAEIGFPLQDGAKGKNKTDYGYNHDLRGGGTIGYRFRFLPANKSFYDLDITMGFQGTSTYKYPPFHLEEDMETGDDYYESEPGKSFSEFIMPISVAASWNYKFTDKFYGGLGVAPTLYVQPQAVFDVSVLAKISYRFSKHCELGLSYQYGCMNVLKHFNDGPALGRNGHLSDLMLSVYIPFVIK